jgi:hypothetical protein
MSDDLDPGLKRLFALTAEHPSDEAFVARAASSARRERLASTVLRGLGLALALALLAAVLAIAFRLVAVEGAAVFGQLAASLASTPFGALGALGLLIAGAVCWRALTQLAGGRRRG